MDCFHGAFGLCNYVRFGGEIAFFAYGYACKAKKEQAAKFTSHKVIWEDEVDGAEADGDIGPLDRAKLMINLSFVQQMRHITLLHALGNDSVSVCGERDFEHGTTRPANSKLLAVGDFSSVAGHLLSDQAQKYGLFEVLTAVV